MNKNFNFLKEDYFPYLLRSLKSAIVALEYLGKSKRAEKNDVNQFIF